VAYPIWEEKLLTDLTDVTMERLFKDANLDDVWDARRDELDHEGVSWEDVLSLGEQQRLQFCRLFWHAEWHKKYGDQSQGFFAVLDESSASMDTTSEMHVYQKCCERKLGFLSVAHRPTVIQFHSKVLLFEFDERHELQHRTRDAAEMAVESAEIIQADEQNNAEHRPKNVRRSMTDQGSPMNMSPTGLGKRNNSRSFGKLTGLMSPLGALPVGMSLQSFGSFTSLTQLHEDHEVSGEAAGGMSSAMIMGMKRIATTKSMRDEDEMLRGLIDGVPEEYEITPGAIVQTPYSNVPESSARFGILGSLWRLVHICHTHTALLVVIGVLNLFAAVMLASWSVIFMNLKSIMKPGMTAEFVALGQGIGVQVSYEDMLPVILIWGPFIGIIKAAANYLTVRLMLAWRTRLVTRLHAMYLSKYGRLYYTLSNLDSRIDSADQTITNDADLLTQFLFEFFAGGVMKPDSGVLFKISVFFVSCSIMWLDVERTMPGQGGFAPSFASVLFLITFGFVEYLGRRCGESQKALQESEGRFRTAHARCRTFAEGISFYGGEATEKVRLDDHFKPVIQNFLVFTSRKFPMEVLQLMFFQGQYTIAMLLGGMVAFKEEDQTRRTMLFDLTNSAMVQCLAALNKITCQVMDFAKTCALSDRVTKLFQVMEAFLLYEFRIRGTSRVDTVPSPVMSPPGSPSSGDGSREPMRLREIDPLINVQGTNCCCAYGITQIEKLQGGELVPVETSNGVEFCHVDVYTPDGLRMLLQDVNLKLDPGESCLIMGPSGIGKSSLLRVLGQLWPLFRTPDNRGLSTTFSRPGPFNLFFLAQRPYLFEGTLRDQVAYPVWGESVQTELTDKRMERLFQESNLTDIWKAHRHELDKTGISWADVLSLGEQQRLQFCRLFWHYEWHQRHGDTSQGFFAVLDESTASMDTTSEMLVYESCRSRGIGFLSVAHRPTVIQYHSKVLLFQFDAQRELRQVVRDAKEMSKEMAALLTRHLSWEQRESTRLPDVAIGAQRASPRLPDVAIGEQRRSPGLPDAAIGR